MNTTRKTDDGLEFVRTNNGDVLVVPVQGANGDRYVRAAASAVVNLGDHR